MRSLYIVTIAFLALTVGYLIWQTLLGTPGATKVTQELALTDLPSRYCPKEARVVTKLDSSPEQTGRIVPVANCRSVGLSGFAVGTLYVKLPQALPFAVTITASAPQSYAPELGDVTEDGVIDDEDELTVRQQLMTNGAAATADLTGDGAVDAEDLSLVRLHRAVGATYGPSGEQVNWKEIGL